MRPTDRDSLCQVAGILQGVSVRRMDAVSWAAVIKSKPRLTGRAVIAQLTGGDSV